MILWLKLDDVGTTSQLAVQRVSWYHRNLLGSGDSAHPELYSVCMSVHPSSAITQVGCNLHITMVHAPLIQHQPRSHILQNTVKTTHIVRQTMACHKKLFRSACVSYHKTYHPPTAAAPPKHGRAEAKAARTDQPGASGTIAASRERAVMYVVRQGCEPQGGVSWYTTTLFFTSTAAL